MAQFLVHTSSLFDPKAKKVLKNTSIVVDSTSGRIVKLLTRKNEEISNGLAENDVDLRGKFVMPGLVDSHTHIFLHSYNEAPSLNQKRDESSTERVLRAANHCRTALLAGYTTYRDLGSESMKEADTNVRDAIARGIIPGPRLYVATRVLASTGSYESRTENSENGHCLPAGADAVDGVEDVRRAVRRRIAAGADIIKFFADYRRRIMRYPPAQQHPYKAGVKFPPDVPNGDFLVFSKEEIDVVISEAALAKCPVSAHAHTADGIMASVLAGVTSIEHGYHSTDEIFKAMAARRTVFVPTLAVAERLHAHRFDAILAGVKRAYDMGVRLACGGDTGTYPHGDNCRELELMIEAGIPVVDVLEACTVGGWEACGGDLCGRKFGWWEEGAQADIIALGTNPEEDKNALRDVQFVMKDGQVWKKDGVAVGMI